MLALQISGMSWNHLRLIQLFWLVLRNDTQLAGVVMIINYTLIKGLSMDINLNR